MSPSHSTLDTNRAMGSADYLRSDLERLYLPVGQMLQLDRVTVLENQATGFMDVSGHWAFPVHFPSDPIFPGTLLIEAAGQTVAVWAWHHGLRGRPRLVRVEARFASPVLPQDSTVALTARVRQRGRICLGSIDVSVGDRNIAGISATIIIVPK